MAPAVLAVCFPTTDQQFIGHVRELVGGAVCSEPIRAAIQALLRENYPLAVVSPRTELGSIEPQTVWYIFRDGGVLGPAPGLAS